MADKKEDKQSEDAKNGADEVDPQLKTKLEGLAGVMVLNGFLMLACLFVFFVFAPDLIDDISVEWLGNEDRASELFSTMIVFIPLALIFLVALCALITAAERYTLLDAPQSHASQIKKIQNAKNELEKSLGVIKFGITSIDMLEKQYQSKLKEVNSLSDKLEEIKHAKGVDVAVIQKQIDALAPTTPKRRNPTLIGGIVIGIIASLAATAIWDYSEDLRT